MQCEANLIKPVVANSARPNENGIREIDIKIQRCDRIKQLSRVLHSIQMIDRSRSPQINQVLFNQKTDKAPTLPNNIFTFYSPIFISFL